MSTLLDVWSDPVNTGIFTTLNTYNVPWGSEQIADSLNQAYYYNHSGGKVISPFVNMVMGSDDELSTDQKATIAKTVYSICHKNWQYEWDAMFATYDPIENYDSTETETIKKTGTDTTSHTGSDTHTLSGTDSTSNTGTVNVVNQGSDSTANGGTVKDENSVENGKTETKNQLYGYNSTDPANDSLNTVTVNQVVNNTQTIDTTSKVDSTLESTQTNNTTDATTYGKSDKESIDLSDATNYNNTNTRDLRRHGNIGVTTSQQMIESELELRKKNFYSLVFRDIDEYLTIGIYE